MAEESTALNAVPAGRALKVVKGVGSRLRKPEAKVEPSAHDLPMNGPGFWILVAVTVFDEVVLDLFANISVVFAIFTFFTGLLIALLTYVYLFISGVSMDMKKGSSLAVATLIEIVPFLNFIPAAVVGLFVIRHLAQTEYREKLKGKKKAESTLQSRADPSRA